MENLDRELTFEIPNNMNFDTYTAQFFTSAKESSKKLSNITAKAIITSTDLQHHQRSTASTGSNQLLQKLGETLFGFGSGNSAVGVSKSDISNPSMDLLRNHIVIDSTDFDAVASSATSDLQQQIEYDKFMNEIWIGIVLTLIIISLVFCICSCFLYHQFRQWKMNYRHNLQQAQDIESVKLNPDCDDPVPEYTLVSGLPTYEAALELMQKSTSLLPGGSNNGSCLIVYPSLFNVFSVSEKDSFAATLSQSSMAVTTATTEATPQPQLPLSIVDGTVTATITTSTTTTTTPTQTMVSQKVKCQNLPRMAFQSIPSYEEATGCQPSQQQQQQQQIFESSAMSPCLMKTPSWCEESTKVLLMDTKN